MPIAPRTARREPKDSQIPSNAPSIVQKAAILYALNQGASQVIEGVIDETIARLHDKYGAR